MSEVILNLAHRNMLKAVFTVLSGTEDIDTEAVLTIADISDALKLDDSDEILKTLEREIRLAFFGQQRKKREIDAEIRRAEASGTEVDQKLYKRLDVATEKLEDMPSGLSYTQLLKTEPQGFEVDKSSLDWLVSVLKDYKWNVVLSRDPDTQKVEPTKKTLSTDEAMAAAGLIRAMKQAAL